MADAIARDSSLALAYDHLVFAAIRAGRRSDARTAIRYRALVGTVGSRGDPDVLPLARLAYDERFVPWRARFRRYYLGWAADSAQVEGIRHVFRTGVAWSDIPESQVALGDLLLAFSGPDSLARASAHEGKAIGLMALGRPGEAFMHVDSAAAIYRSDVARLEQAEWRVVLRALGLPIADAGEWRSRLSAYVADTVFGARAAWALAIAAYAAGDTTEGHRWRTQLPIGRFRNQPLERFLSAMAFAARSEWPAALALSDSLDMVFNAADPPSPFARGAFHLYRGTWLAASGDTHAADREWLWYEGSDIEGWPHGPVQAGEIDGMLGVYARLLRGHALLRSAADGREHARGCAYLRRVVELWDGAEPAFEVLTARADSLVRKCSP
jgi:hypothetical protein